MNSRRVALAAALALGLMSGTAMASPLLFTVTAGNQFPFLDGNVVSFQLDSHPSPQIHNGDYIVFFDVPASVTESNNITSKFKAQIFFDTPGDNGGIQIYNENGYVPLEDSNGPQIFSGSYDDPTFSPGVTVLDNGTVVAITPAPVLSTVPLPASAPMFGAALMALGGFGYGMNRWVAPKGKASA